MPLGAALEHVGWVWSTDNGDVFFDPLVTERPDARAEPVYRLRKRTLDDEDVCVRCGVPDVHCFCPDFDARFPVRLSDVIGHERVQEMAEADEKARRDSRRRRRPRRA